MSNSAAEDKESAVREAKKQQKIFIVKIAQKKMEIFTADSFTKKPFEGNPAAVCILADKASEQLPYTNETERDELFQKIAREMSLSETAFVTKTSTSRSEKDHEQSFFLQWFTPTNEVTLCGLIFFCIL